MMCRCKFTDCKKCAPPAWDVDRLVCLCRPPPPRTRVAGACSAQRPPIPTRADPTQGRAWRVFKSPRVFISGSRPRRTEVTPPWFRAGGGEDLGSSRAGAQPRASSLCSRSSPTAGQAVGRLMSSVEGPNVDGGGDRPAGQRRPSALSQATCEDAQCPGTVPPGLLSSVQRRCWCGEPSSRGRWLGAVTVLCDRPQD